MGQILQFSPKPLAKIGFQKVRRRKKPARPENQLDLFAEQQGRILHLPRTTSLFDEALLLDERGDARARQGYLNAIEEGDSTSDAYCNLGIIESSQGRTAEAFDCFTKSLKVDPRHLESHYNLGNLYFEAGDFKLAKIHFVMAIEIRPTYANAYFNLGLIHALGKDFATAAAAFGKYVELVPENEGIKAQELLSGLKHSLETR